MDSKTLATLAFLDAFGAEQSLLTYSADLSGPALRYLQILCVKFHRRLYLQILCVEFHRRPCFQIRCVSFFQILRFLFVRGLWMLMLLYGHSGDVDSAAWPSAWLLQLTESEVSKEGSESKVLVDIGLL